MTEDASSTIDLFDGLGRPIDPQPGEPPSSTLPPNTDAYRPHPDEQPLVRYEWHTAAGDVLVVEAAWPGSTPIEPSTRVSDEVGTSGAVGSSGYRRFEPPLDLRRNTDVH